MIWFVKRFATFIHIIHNDQAKSIHARIYQDKNWLERGVDHCWSLSVMKSDCGRICNIKKVEDFLRKNESSTSYVAP